MSICDISVNSEKVRKKYLLLCVKENPQRLIFQVVFNKSLTIKKCNILCLLNKSYFKN